MLSRIIFTYFVCIFNTINADDQDTLLKLDYLSELSQLPAPYFRDAIDVQGADPFFVASEADTSVEFFVKPIYLDALPFRSMDTKVFSWLSLPSGEMDNSKVPAVVLVHGGGGTAFKDWCIEWAKRGFASIALALEGQTDVRIKRGGKNSHGDIYELHDWPGPRRPEVAYGDWDDYIEDQWMFHAVADTILGNSFLRSFPGIDEDMIGVVGVSWGGVVASTAIGYDNRFAFAVSGYGCGAMSRSNNHIGDQIRRGGDGKVGNSTFYDTFWDPIQRFSRVTIPTMWFSFPQEIRFPLPVHATTYNSLTAPIMTTYIPDLGHGAERIWEREESYEFARSVTKGQRRIWAQQVFEEKQDIGRHGQFEYRVLFESSKNFVTGKIISTNDSISIMSGNRHWDYRNVSTLEMVKCENKQGEISCLWSATARLSSQTTSWFINLCTEDEICVSSRFNQPDSDLED